MTHSANMVNTGTLGVGRDTSMVLGVSLKRPRVPGSLEGCQRSDAGVSNEDSDDTWKADAPRGREQRAETLQEGQGNEGGGQENKAWRIVGRGRMVSRNIRERGLDAKEGVKGQKGKRQGEDK
jgi:hypothetical protein